MPALSDSIDLTDKQRLREQLQRGDLVLYERKLYTREDFKTLVDLENKVEDLDLEQTVKKLDLNSAYGALLNKASRFNDTRLGASTTGSGRQVTTHLMGTLGTLCDGKRAALVKHTIIESNGDVTNSYSTTHPFIIYGDTDSCFFKVPKAPNETLEDVVAKADKFAIALNATFKEFTRDKFLCSDGYDSELKAVRETVGKSAIFVKKKMYIVALYDKEGKRIKKGDRAYYKIMGLTMKKSDTPKPVRAFLLNVYDMILDGEDNVKVDDYIIGMRDKVLHTGDDLWILGINKQVNAVDKYQEAYDTPGLRNPENGRKVVVPGHVRAAMNYNTILKENGSTDKPIDSGDKVYLFYLRKNIRNWDSIAFPVEMETFPDWFEDNFRVDKRKTENMLFDSKLESLFEAMGRTVPDAQTKYAESLFS